MTASLRATAVLARREPIFALSFSPQVRSEFSYRTLVISALAVPRRPESPWLFTVVVGGAGLTGIEAATEMPEKLRAMLARANLNRPFHVILADHNPHVGSDMGESARPVIEEALAALGIEMRSVR